MDSHGVDLTGRRFGHLTVIGKAPDKTGSTGLTYKMWKCACDCGVVKDVSRHSLVLGYTISCGCVRKEKHRWVLTKFSNKKQKTVGAHEKQK